MISIRSSTSRCFKAEVSKRIAASFSVSRAFIQPGTNVYFDAGAKLIVVLGHSECGAVKGAIDDAKLGSLTGVLQQIRPALTKLDYKGVPSSKDRALVQRVAEQNARDAAMMLTSRSQTMAGLVREGKLKIVHAMHDVATGKVAWIG